MGKVLAVLLLLAASLSAQTASVRYTGPAGSGCGWFSIPSQDLVITRPPKIGSYLEVQTSIPRYGLDYLAWGRADPSWVLPQAPVGGKRCKLHSWWVPHVIKQWILPVRIHQFPIPSDTALIGARISVQQMNLDVWVVPNRWETSRGAILTLGY